ncbi:MAG: indolepyruvate oxidoreductase subunit beta [Candidatus Aminicenantes bacterium]|nr:indolepyruvate oxidoreductase subunit beta [Candidatus Aminicenantes bacterium]
MEGRSADKQDIILAGVGGQGILSIAYVIDRAALDEGLHLRQAEVHGMAQRGGAVQSHLRLSSGTIFSDLIPRGGADMILSVEPLEALRYLDSLAPTGVVVSSSTPYRNIADYPDLGNVLERLRRVPRHVIADSEKLAKEAGSSRAQNIVMLGAASPFLILKEDSLLRHIENLFKPRGANLVDINIKALRLGRAAAGV